VYRGELGGVPVAVKVMATGPDAMQGPNEFQAEVTILTKLHHPNIVMLLGSCPEKVRPTSRAQYHATCALSALSSCHLYNVRGLTILYARAGYAGV
jgi:hypothetical protein